MRFLHTIDHIFNILAVITLNLSYAVFSIDVVVVILVFGIEVGPRQQGSLAQCSIR
jgi:ABC-type uncharacterized transport system permease subunit